MKSLLALGVLAALTAAPAAVQKLPPALEALVNTERAFAKAATEKGIRDSFLEFFAEDAIAFNPAPVSAIERLRSRPGRPFSEYELRWEPREGDIAASGELGWLTGPSTFIDHTSPTPARQYGNYLSVWRRQGDGPWRVLIDIGSSPPQAVSFEPGFARFPFPSRYAGGNPSASAAALLEADRTLNARSASAGAGAAYAEVTTSASRLHRSGFMPPRGSTAIRAWMDANVPEMTAQTRRADCARSGDLGYSYGTFDVKGTAPRQGAYVRVWQREAAGRWVLVADVVQAP